MTEGEIQALVAEAGLVRGAMPLTKQQLNDRVMALLERDWPLAMREAMPEAYAVWRTEAEPARSAAVAANKFNVQLAAYRTAVTRLKKYLLADGRPEIAEDRDIGEVDENGDAILTFVVVQDAIDPLPATIEMPAVDPVTGEATGFEVVVNPEIVADEVARSAAQAVIDGTPVEVSEFAAAFF